MPRHYLPILEEFEETCLEAARLIGELKAEGLSYDEKEELIGELSVSISSLRIKTELIEEDWETTEDIVL
jgi:hypothetical protein